MSMQEYEESYIRFLRKMGIPEEEIQRLFLTGDQILTNDWPGPSTGLDLMPQITPNVPDTGWPPYFQPNTQGPTEPFPTFPTPDPIGSVKTNDPISHVYNVTQPPYQGDDKNWLGMANDVGSESPMDGLHGFNATKSIPEWRYNIEDSQMIPTELPPIAIYPSGGMVREALMEVRQEFGWLSDDYVERAKGIAESNGGQLYLIRASQEAITDHRSEGEQYRRKLDGMELFAMARTAIGHGMDINHNPEWRTGAQVVDSEYDPNTKSIQMVVMETDPQINQMVANGQITAVSINGGSPRTETIEPCGSPDGELCNVPRGVVLGELDGIALTWVVTDPRGVMWNGIQVPFAQPGVKTTAIQPI